MSLKYILTGVGVASRSKIARAPENKKASKVVFFLCASECLSKEHI